MNNISDTPIKTLPSAPAQPTGDANLIFDAGDINAVGNDTINPDSPPQVLGEQSVSGDMPDPGSDDDVLNLSHQVGLRLDENEESPQPLNIAADINEAEK